MTLITLNLTAFLVIAAFSLIAARRLDSARTEKSQSGGGAA